MTDKPGLDRNSENRLRRGEMPIDARLDLHGLTQDRAARSLHDFVLDAYDEGLRCLLVITGKGRPRDDSRPWYEPQAGILRERVPDWLREPGLRDKILRVVPAARHHGGDGAYYILLRRQRG